ncbi:MAG: serine protein kinase RIO [Candidatus Hydrothermarchaeota archaeon]
MGRLEERLSRLDRKIDAARKRIKGVEDRRVASEVFDKATLLTLYDLANRGVIDLLYGVIKTGKEANVLKGYGKGGEPLAVKIHLVGTRNYRAMLKYIDGDYRFKGVKRSTRSVVYTWVKKEFKNMERALEAGVKVPMPIAYKNNVLVMDFIGRGEVPAPMLKHVFPAEPDRLYRKVLGYMRALYCRAGLVHADLSEYNILMRDGTPYIIDLSQAVVIEHPQAQEFLRADVRNMANYFRSYLEVDEGEMLKYITDCRRVKRWST